MKKLVLFLAAFMPLVLFAQSKKIVVVGLTADEVAELRRTSPSGVTIVTPSSAANVVTSVTPDAPGREQERAAVIKEVADADAFIGGPTAEMVRAGKKLKWIQIISAGIENYRYPELINSSIVVTNAKGIASPAIADHGFGMLLALTRNLTYFIEQRTKESWSRRPYNLLELKGKTALVIGVGNIGMQVAQRAHAFDMSVIGVDPKELSASHVVQRLVYPDRLDEVLPLADVVFMCAPLTPESTKMMGAKQFDLMKKNSYFIALSRGGTYDLDALVRALDSKKLAGAGVDVTAIEPLPKGHALWKFPNVIITPHIATQSEMEFPRRMEMLKENIQRFSRGEQLINVVDVKKGY